MRKILLLSLGLAAPLALQAQEREEFRWRGTLAAGKTFEVKGVNGDVRAAAATGDEIEVVALKRGRKDDPREVKMEVLEHAGGITICAVYPTPARAKHDNDCQPGEKGHSSVNNFDVKVDFEIRVPARVRFAGRTVNGEIDVQGLGSSVEAHTVNGDVSISTQGYADAATVNGSIRASMGSADWKEGIAFSTVNGSVTIDAPSNLDADIWFSTLNGSIDTDFPVNFTGRVTPRRMRGKIGQGGREISIETLNGAIRLRRRAAS